MSAPLVTAIIATRGREELRRAVDAVLAQDLDDDLECLVVFDQTEADRSFEHAGPGREVRVLANARCPGLAGGRNTGILAARGRYLAFCDDDDEWRPAKLTAQLGTLAATPGAKAATSGIEVRYGDRARVRVPVAEHLTFDGLLLDRSTEAHPSTYLLERRLVLEEVGLVDEDLPGSYAEDYDFLLRIARATTIVVAPEPHTIVWWHGGSFFFERWQMIDDALGYLTDKYPEFAGQPRGLARIRGQQAIARAALGDRTGAWGRVKETIALRPTEKRAWLALLIASGAVSGERALRLANHFGRGL